MDQSNQASYAQDGQKSTETPDPVGGDVQSRVKSRNKKVAEQAGDTGTHKGGSSYTSAAKNKRYKNQLDEAGKI